MSLLTDLEGFIESPSEANALKIATDIKTGLEIFESDLTAGLKWVASVEPQVVSGLQAAMSIATEVGAASNPEVSAVLAATNTAISTLQVITNDINSGVSTQQTLVDGVIAAKTAQAAVSTATAAVIKAPVAPTSAAA